MERETFLIRDLIEQLGLDEDDIYGIDDIPGYKLVEFEIMGIDLEKGYSRIKNICKRDLDNKFFKIEYVYSYDFSEFLESEATEVFPKEVVTTIHE